MIITLAVILVCAPLAWFFVDLARSVESPKHFSESDADLLATLRASDKIIAVFVALADPKHTGIEALPDSIGNGDNAETNLYWGNDEGLKGVFDRSKQWKLESKSETPSAEVVLSKRVYRRIGGNLLMMARAYRGSAMRECVQDFESAVSKGRFDLVVFIGHDGLMDFQLPMPAPAVAHPKIPDCMALCCLSEDYFKPRLLAGGGHPVLLTTQKMYPGAFILEAALTPWAAGKRPSQIRESAAAAYARNQKISQRAALGVFATLKE